MRAHFPLIPIEFQAELNHYKILTVTHKQVPVDMLPHYSMNNGEGDQGLAGRLTALKTENGLDELMYLSTCNRVTYFFTTLQSIENDFATHFFKSVNAGFETSFTQNINFYEGQAALAHLCELGASLDSMVVGEREIIRQLRQAYEQSHQMKLTGDDIRLAMKFVIPAAKRIYTETRIAEKPVSIVSLAAQKLKQLKLPRHSKFILIGAGETIANMAAYLRDMGFKHFTIFNRTFTHAQILAEKINGEVYPLSSINEYRQGFDVIISSTASQKEIITETVYRNLLNGDTAHKVIIDLAIPFDTEPSVIANYPVEYIQIESLRKEAQKNLTSRKAEIYKAKQLVHEFVKEFQRNYMERMVEKAHSVIPVKLNEIKTRALEKVYQKEIEKMDEHAKETLLKVITYMEKKYIALTMSSSKEAFRKHH